MVKTDIEGHQIDFILDTGVAISTMTTPTGQLTKDAITIIGPPETPRSTGMVGGHQVRHWFLYVPEAPGPLLGRDLLSKLGTTVSMDLGPPDVSALPVLTLEVSLEEWHIHTPRDNKPVGPQPFLDHLMKWFLGVWDQDGRIRLATGHPPILVTVKPGANLVRQRQYPIPPEARKGVVPHIQCLRGQGILREVQ
jgi:hypothetical protein